MKKVLSFITVLLLSVVLIACGDTAVDGSVEKLEKAHTSLSTLISDPSNITRSFNVNTVLAGGVSATWTSADEATVKFAAPQNGLSQANVTRPAYGEADKVVKITALLSIKSELSDDVLTKDWSVDLTVKAETVAPINIETIADVLALKDEAYDGGVYQVTIPNITVFAKGDARFGYDGTGIIQLFNSQTDFVVGKVYTITASLEWYFGIWELIKGVGIEDTTATPQFPVKEVVTSIDAQIAALEAANAHKFLKVADGNYEPIYATITGKVHVITGDTSNYSTYIIDTTATELVLGTDVKPASGLMLYYKTDDFGLVQQFNGLVVTMDVVIYTYRSNNLAFAIYYVGGPTGISAVVTDQQAVDIAKNALTVQSEVTEANTVLNFPTTSSTGATIAWSYVDSANTNNDKVNLTTGAVTLPEAGTQVEVKVLATITKGEVTDTKEFTIKLGELPLITVEAAFKLAAGSKVRVEGTALGYSGNGQIAFGDSTGGFTVYNTTAAPELYGKVGKKFEVIGEISVYNGLKQLNNAVWKELGDGTVPAAVNLQTLEAWGDALLPYQNLIVSAQNLKVTSTTVNDQGRLTLALVDDLTGNTISVYVHNQLPIEQAAKDLLYGLKVGEYVSFNSVILGWSKGPQLSVIKASEVALGTAPTLTDAQKLANDVKTVSVVETTDKDLVLPVGPLANGTTVVWASNNVAVIANDGKLTLPAVDTTVELTATFTLGSESQTKVFTVVVKAPVVTDGDAVSVVIKSAGKVTTNIADGSLASYLNLSSDAIPFTVMYESLSASTKSIFNNDGGQTRLYGGASNNGGKLTITAGQGYVIESIEITFGGNNVGLSVNGAAAVNTSNSASTFVVNGATVTLQNVAASGRVDMAQIKINFVPVAA